MKIVVAGDSVGVTLAEVLAAHLGTCKGVEVSHQSQSPSGSAEYYANVIDQNAVS